MSQHEKQQVNVSKSANKTLKTTQEMSAAIAAHPDVNTYMPLSAA